MRKRAEDAAVRRHTVEQHGDPVEITELDANARAVDLIVGCGEARRGCGSRRSMVAERVIRRTSVPTLVVPSDASDTPSGFRNVLVAVDLSSVSKDVLRGAIGLIANRRGAAHGDPYGQASRSSGSSHVDGAGTLMDPAAPRARPSRDGDWLRRL